MRIEDLEEQARFEAKNAKRNLKMIKRQAEYIDPIKLKRNIRWLEMLIWLHECEMHHAKEQHKKARLAGRTSLRTRLKYLVVSILREDNHKHNEKTA
ncbi:hypothetical protein M2444_002360 [Paenibacillus sp. PastF-3]|uniref:hypothetical protein n=1 Tax=Paenibacillus sp. PastF-3 TaxID=2940626 RepID=UPI0024730870|nr:hypothetical protein [Paenibacillus sp. PastF-3]MDH6370580.1 hypothetical protein [Paenibacillus sp. PastF-3]